MDEVADSLNEMSSSTVAAATDVVGTRVNDDAVINATSPVITVAADLPSFHYFISEQAKSMLALQELQNEVGALLEFRDLVMDAFPQLVQKMPQFQNASPNVMSPTNKWEPGIRVKRKLGQQLRDQDVLVPSLVPRYRSNSQGKTSRSGEVSGSATSSSAIQDSGFCTESNKDHSSAISSRGKSRETDDELFSLLDTIHSRGTRLKQEVQYLWSRLNRKPGSLLGSGKRRCRSLDDLITNNSTSAFEHSMNAALLDSELSDLRHERDMLLKKLAEIETEHFANLAHTNRLLAELETVSAEKRNLEERLQNVQSNDANFLSRQQRNATTPFAKCQLLKLTQFFKENTTREDTSNQRETLYEHSSTPDRPSNPLTKQLSSTVYQVDGKESRLDLREEFDKKKRRSKKTECECQNGTCERCTIASIGKPDILIGFLSGHSSFPEPTKASITLSKEKVLSILNEFNPVELHRYLLTLSYQIEALNVHVQRISKSRMNIFQQLNRYKIENEDLKFQLEEKNIQLEGTKAKVRVLERMRNEKFSYSTSDLNDAKPTSHDSSHTFTCPVSDTALLTEKTVTTLSCAKHSEKCTDLRDRSDSIRRTKSASSSCTSTISSLSTPQCRRISKIPLKTNSTTKLPTKLASSYKKLTSFKDSKEFSAPGPPPPVLCSSCVSSTSSSLNNK